ncbi:hypothetical protein OE749_15420 [Aestuariibacter sp. AA17]|uniref:DNA polymerase III subunit psi n=1 Tax=Fluctibacter corallii TaxID=2984329 RepID=A0ABT3ABP8_9ALTE|nr:hypothetical protein [Aestuariibacter sp. AA17]MCV2886083.1 hypothetical protein [Aestuariibacter sp. AA17]
MKTSSHLNSYQRAVLSQLGIQSWVYRDDIPLQVTLNESESPANSSPASLNADIGDSHATQSSVSQVDGDSSVATDTSKLSLGGKPLCLFDASELPPWLLQDLMLCTSLTHSDLVFDASVSLASVYEKYTDVGWVLLKDKLTTTNTVAHVPAQFVLSDTGLTATDKKRLWQQLQSI